MYKSKIALLQFIWGVSLFILGLLGIASNYEIISISKSNTNLITPLLLLLLSLIFISINVLKIGIKIYFEGDYLIIDKRGRQERISLSSITTIVYKNDYRNLSLSTINKKYKVSLELKRSSNFLTEFYEKLKKESVEYDRNEEIYALMRCTVRDHQTQRLRSYLWIAAVLTFITFYLSVWLTDSLTALNIFRIIILIVLPITTLLLTEVSFANQIEKKYQIEKINEVKRDRDYERQIYRKYLSISLLICLLIFITYTI